MSLFDFDKFLWGDNQKFPSTRSAVSEDIPPSSWPLGQLWIGRPASGKTVALARMMVDHFATHPRESMISVDGSQAFTDTFIRITLSQPPHIRDSILKRLIYDELGHPDWVLTLPEFHERYEQPMEKQITRAIQNFEALNPQLVKETPVMGGIPIQIYGRELFRLLTVIPNEYKTSWQLTEAKQLLVNKGLLTRVLRDFGRLAPTAKWFFEEKFNKMKSEDEKDKRTLALISVLDDIEAPEIRPRIGYHRPSYTIPQVIREGKILLVNAHRVNDQKRTLAYLLTQVKSLLMNEISKRTPNNPNDHMVTFLLDEVPSLLEYADMQTTLKEMVSYHRSRKLSPIIVGQNLAQFPIDLRPHIWSYANVVCFKLLNFNDAFETAQQLFPYIPETIKATSSDGHDLYEPDRGQYLQIANQIRNLGHREAIVRKQSSETDSEKYIQWVKKTKEATMTASDHDVQDLKDILLEKYGQRVDEVNASINRRLSGPPKPDDDVRPDLS